MSKSVPVMLDLLRGIASDVAELKIALEAIQARTKKDESDVAELKATVEAIDARTKKMDEGVEAIQAENTSAAVNSEGLLKTLNVKFDMLKNLEQTSREAVQNVAARGVKPTRPAFFKTIFLEEREQHVGTLYEQADLDEVLEDSDVKAKKKPLDRSNKAAALLYAKCIKGEANKARSDVFERLYTSRYP